MSLSMNEYAPGKPCLVGQGGPLPIQLTALNGGQPIQHAARWGSATATAARHPLDASKMIRR